MHVFENAGLGAAPFKFVGYVEARGSSCDYCGTSIMGCYLIKSADGRRFKVGCDCVRKTGDVGLIVVVDDAAKKAKRKAKAARDLAKIALAQETLAANPELLADRPHPSIKGKTLRDYATWMMANAGTTGRLYVCRLISA